MDRRALRLKNYDDIVREAEALRASGYERVGKWGLGEICHHLALVMELAIEGYPKLMPWPVRLLFRWFFLPRVMQHKVMTRKVDAPAYLMPPNDPDEAAAIDRLRRAVQRLKTHQGPLQPSPILGDLTADQWLAVNLWHSEHHLSFLLPRTEKAQGQG